MNVEGFGKGLSVTTATAAVVMLLFYASGFALPVVFPPPWIAVALLSAGAALLIGPPKSLSAAIVLSLCALAVLSIGIFGWCENVLGIDPGIDRILFPNELLKGLANPGRPGLLTCVNLTIIAIEILLLAAGSAPLVTLRELLGVLGTALAFMGFGNFLLQQKATAVVAMWPVTALLCIACSLSALCRGRNSRLIPLLFDEGPAGELSRRLMPLPLVFFLVVEGTRVVLRRAGFHGPNTGFILTSIEIILPIYIVWLSCARILRVDHKRRDVEEELRKSRDEMEKRVHQRTSELLTANHRLEIEGTSRSLAQHELQGINTLLAGIIDACPLAICAFHADGSVRKTNAAAAALLASGALQSGEIKMSDLVGRAAAGEQIIGLEVNATVEKISRVFNIWASPMLGPDQRMDGVVLMAADVSDRKALELQVRVTQKLESLGVLAGGIAHDFNNLLTGILGNVSLVHDMLPAASPMRSFLEQAIVGSQRAAELTRQLLAYAGKGQFVIGNVDLSKVVGEVSGLIQSSVPKNVELRLQLAKDLPPIQADSSQIHQVVMNLVINAAEAIEERGTVLVLTGSEWLEGEGIAPGLYVMLEVIDDGAGMDHETQQRMFEPFFTTKFTGRGLGLAAVQGIVRAHKGMLNVVSSPGAGTTFRVQFPAAARVNKAVETERHRSEERRGAGTVLVIEDEDTVRKVATSVLKAHGYRVESAATGEAGLQIFSGKCDEIRIVLLDLTMPGIGGPETLRRLKSVNPDVPVVLSSGYSEAEVSAQFDGGLLAGFLQKPYTSAQLIRKIDSARDMRR